MKTIYQHDNDLLNLEFPAIRDILLLLVNFNMLIIVYHFSIRVKFMHNHQDFFLNPTHPTQKLYEALRSFYVGRLSASDVAQKFGWSTNYFNKLRTQFHQALLSNDPPEFFVKKTSGPTPLKVEESVKERIIALRKNAYSIQDIQAVLQAQGLELSLRQIHNVLTTSGFPRLPKRTRREKQRMQLPHTIQPQKVRPLELNAHSCQQMTTRYGGLFFFLPFITQLNLLSIVQQAQYPATQQLSAHHYILSLLFLKLLDKERLSHIDDVNLDAGAGLFAGLNGLPKSSAISSYSYTTDRQMNRSFLKGLYQSVQAFSPYSGDITLDFTAIPHWGDQSVLERNWNGSRGKALKSVLALVALDPDTGFMPYGNAEISHKSKNDALFQFVDFWRDASSQPLKCLIFDAKFTTYENLSRLNHDGIKFITLRRRGKKLIQHANELLKNRWNTVHLDTLSRKYRNVNVHESQMTLKGYDGTLRQLIVTGHGRQTPAFIITNDFRFTQKTIITKYARRWLVEKSISEQIHFFHLNLLSSSIVMKVDLDLTMTIAAHTLYRLMAKTLSGFEQAESKTIFRRFIDTTADIDIDYPNIHVKVLKKAHYPILFEEDLFQRAHSIPWLNNARLKFSMKNST